MKFGLAVISAFLAGTCLAAPAKVARQAGSDPSSIGINLSPLGDIVHDLESVINVPLDGSSHSLGDLLKQAGISGNNDTKLSSLQATNAAGKFTCDLSLDLAHLVHLNSDQSILSFIPLPEFSHGLRLADLLNSNITCRNA